MEGAEKDRCGGIGIREGCWLRKSADPPGRDRRRKGGNSLRKGKKRSAPSQQAVSVSRAKINTATPNKWVEGACRYYVLRVCVCVYIVGRGEADGPSVSYEHEQPHPASKLDLAQLARSSPHTSQTTAIWRWGLERGEAVPRGGSPPLLDAVWREESRAAPRSAACGLLAVLRRPRSQGLAATAQPCNGRVRVRSGTGARPAQVVGRQGSARLVAAPHTPGSRTGGPSFD